jgi:hypothetical protein
MRIDHNPTVGKIELLAGGWKEESSDGSNQPSAYTTNERMTISSMKPELEVYYRTTDPDTTLPPTQQVKERSGQMLFLLVAHDQLLWYTSFF